MATIPRVLHRNQSSDMLVIIHRETGSGNFEAVFGEIDWHVSAYIMGNAQVVSMITSALLDYSIYELEISLSASGNMNSFIHKFPNSE